MINLIKSSFYQEKKVKNDLIGFIKKARTFSMGEECQRFERDFAKQQGRKFAVFVSSGSLANLVLIQSLLNLGRLKKGDRVGFSALTWSTNVMPLLQLGLIPVPLDCNLETLNVGPQEIKKTTGLKAVFLTNVLGFSDDIKGIRRFCGAKKIILLEDNCESLGTKCGGILLGNFSLASTFSFFVGHHLSTIEGGMICTDDRKLYDMLVIARIHGWDRNLDERAKKSLRIKYKVEKFYALYTFYDLAYNARPGEINGFIGNAQLKYWKEIVARRESNFRIFYQRTLKNKNIIPLKLDHLDRISNFAMPLVFRDKAIMEKYKKRFLAAKVEIRPIIAGNILNQPFYKKYVKNKKTCLNADLVHSQGFYFPNNPELTKKELATLVGLLDN